MLTNNDTFSEEFNVFKRFPVVSFFILTYSFTWTFHILIPLLGYNLSSSFEDPSIYLYFLGILGPLFSANFVQYKTGGWAGIKQFYNNCFQGRGKTKWYLFSIFSVPVLLFTNIFISTGEFPIQEKFLHFSLIPLVAQLWIIVGEEFGWRGFVLPRLQRRYGTLGASILLGLLWAVWHLPMFFVPGSGQFTTNFLSDFSEYVLILIFWSIIMTMLYNKTGKSIITGLLFHAFVNFGAWTIATPEGSQHILVLYLPLVLFSIYYLPRPFFKGFHK